MCQYFHWIACLTVAFVLVGMRSCFDCWMVNWAAGLVVSLWLGTLFCGWFLKRLRTLMDLPEQQPKRSNHHADNNFFTVMQTLFTKNADGKKWRRVPPLLFGIVERLFFTVAIASGGPRQITSVVSAMFIWTTVKMITHWNSPIFWNQQGPPPMLGALPEEMRFHQKNGALAALLTTLISMFFALIGGWIIVGFPEDKSDQPRAAIKSAVESTSSGTTCR